jgi:pullulanase-type alpha-1,6-glucosidase
VARKADQTVAKATQVQTARALDDLYAYDGPLGVGFDAGGAPTFRLWAPTAQSVKLHVYDAVKAEVAAATLAQVEPAVWTHVGPASWKGNYYQYELVAYHPATGRVETLVTTDPYAASLSTNGLHAQVVDLSDAALKPPAWDALAKPALGAPEDIVVYEGHVRDFSAGDLTVPAARRGKYLGFVTDAGAAQSDGLAHLAALASAGLTHLHLLPAFDFATVDEDPLNRVDVDQPFSRLCSLNAAVPPATCAQFGAGAIREALAGYPGDSDQQQVIASYMRSLDSFNWGYDPVHFGVPEGSYASDAEGTARILEFRRMVQGLAAVGLRVVMDVVYNHTNAAGVGPKSVLDKVVPWYYHRLHPETGYVESSSCCANTASEHHMMEKLMVDLSVRWARDYKVDGFRFDLMGLHMKSNVEKVLAALQALTPAADGVDGSAIYVYGEGWDMGEMARNARGVNATQGNMAGTGIGTFNDRIRDGVRGGGPFDGGAALKANQGFATGLFVDPNDAATALPADRDKLNQLADWIKIGMAGNLKFFRLVTYNDSTTYGGAIGYGGQGVGYAEDPQEVANYVSAHDNEVLWDIAQYKLPATRTTAERVRMHDLALDLVLLGQGVPFVHMGDDLLRSKSMDKNSYDSGDWFNRVDWTGAESGWRSGLPGFDSRGNWTVIAPLLANALIAPGPADIAAASAHFREMLRIRKSSPLFRLRAKADVLARVDFTNFGSTQVPGVIAMTITDGACAGADLDAARDAIAVIANADVVPHGMAVTGASGFTLHSLQQASADAVVRGASFDAGTSTFTVPARTTAVFEQLQAGAQGAGLPCNTR